MLIFPHSSQASICPPKADVLHFNANKVLNCQEFNPKSSNFEPTCLKHRQLRIEVEIEVELAVFLWF